MGELSVALWCERMERHQREARNKASLVVLQQRTAATVILQTAQSVLLTKRYFFASKADKLKLREVAYNKKLTRWL